MSLDYKALGVRLRQKFAHAAGAQDLLRRVDFEEALADRHGDQQPTFIQRILKVLDEHVPNIKLEVMTVAMLLPLPRGMMNEQRDLDGLSQEPRDLYLLMTRQSTLSLAATKSPEAAQLSMAFMIVNAELMEEMRAKSYIPYAQVTAMAQEMCSVKTMIGNGMVDADAPALHTVFADTANRLENAAKDFFGTKNNKPPRP